MDSGVVGPGLLNTVTNSKDYKEYDHTKPFKRYYRVRPFALSLNIPKRLTAVAQNNAVIGGYNV